MFKLFLGMFLICGGLSYGVYAYQYIVNDVLVSTFSTAGALLFAAFMLTFDGITSVIVGLKEK